MSINETTAIKDRRFSTRRVVVIVLLLVIAGAGYGMYEKRSNVSDAERAKQELEAAITEVSQLMILPEGDEPVLATVTDAEALKAQQAFFNGAVNGDQLLLFPRNLKAVLWSPSRNVIVNAGPIEQQSAAPVPINGAGSPQKDYTQSLLNGSGQANSPQAVEPGPPALPPAGEPDSAATGEADSEQNDPVSNYSN